MKHTLCWLKMSRKDSSWIMDLSHYLLQVLLSKLTMQSLKQLYLCWYLKFHIKLYVIGKGKNWTFWSQEINNIQQKIYIYIYIYMNKTYFCIIILKLFSECNFARKVVYFVYYIRNIFFSSISKQNSPNICRNIERVAIFFKFILWRCKIMQKR